MTRHDKPSLQTWPVCGHLDFLDTRQRIKMRGQLDPQYGDSARGKLALQQWQVANTLVFCWN
jgi:hypothetical protein